MEYCKKIELTPFEDNKLKKSNENKNNECSEKVVIINKEYVSNLLKEILNKSNLKKRKNKSKTKVKKTKTINKIQDKNLNPIKWDYV